MSRLKQLVDNLIQVIVSYYQTQTHDSHHSIDHLFKGITSKALDEWLNHLITEGTKTYPARRSFLQYYQNIIRHLYPLLNRDTPLDDIEEGFVFSNLTCLLNNTGTLLKMSQTSTLNIRHLETNAAMPGFVRGGLRAYSFCNAGQTVMKQLFEPLKLDKNNSETHVTALIGKLLAKHQQPLLLKQAQTMLAEQTTENDTLKKALQSEQDDHLRLHQEIATLKLRVNSLQGKLTGTTTELENAKIKISSLMSSIRPEHAQAGKPDSGAPTITASALVLPTVHRLKTNTNPSEEVSRYPSILQSFFGAGSDSRLNDALEGPFIGSSTPFSPNL